MLARYLGYGRQTIDEQDIECVVTSLSQDFLTQGPTTTKFEEALAEYVGAKHAVVVSSGTAALHVAALAAGAAEPGTLGVTQSLTFVASANCLAYCNAQVGLVDIDPETLMMAPEALKQFLAKYPETKIVVPVSMTGLSSHNESLREIAGSRIVIEDASHALGATRSDGRKVGGPGFADMTVFSLHPVKPITTGEGGAVVTDDDELARRLRLYRSHGIEREADRLVDASGKTKPWYYEQQVLGLNYRMNDIQAALGLSQLARLDTRIAQRRAIVQQYDELFQTIETVTPLVAQGPQRLQSGHHIYVVSIDFDTLKKPRAEVMNALRARNIGTQVHYIPVHRQPFWAERFVNLTDRFPNSDRYYQTCLTLPCFPGMTSDEVSFVAESVAAVLSA